LNDRPQSWIVESDAERTRLDRFLADRLKGDSRSQIQNWIRRGFVLVNGERVKTGYRIRTSDRIALKKPIDSPDFPLPEEIPLEIIYEDSDIAVINKPAGLVCHAGAGIRSGTLVNALLYKMGSLKAGDPSRPGIVHRLDKLTSGVMLIAKNNAAHRRLAQQFKSRQVRKEYIAMVHGSLSPSSGTIDSPLGRDPKNRKKMSSRAHRKRDAITHYVTEDDYCFASLLRVNIETGRTHQIRVHLSEKGHPIVGDALYGANRKRNLPTQLSSAAKVLQRPFLHSRRLEFTHPRSGKRLSFRAPLAPELQHFLSAVRSMQPRISDNGPA